MRNSYSFSKASFDLRNILSGPRGREWKLYPSTLGIQWPHRLFAQKDLNKVKWLISLSSPLLVHWTTSASVSGGGRVFMWTRRLSWSHFPGSRALETILSSTGQASFTPGPGWGPRNSNDRETQLRVSQGPRQTGNRFITLLIKCLLFNKPLNSN